MNNNYIGVDLSLFRQPEIQKLDIALGKGALAIYLQICFKLAESDGYFLLEDIPILEREFFVKKDLLESIINFKDLFEINKGKFSCKWVLDRLEKIRLKSNLAKKSIEARWNKTPKNKGNDTVVSRTNKRTNNESNTNKEKKIKKIKENKEIITSFFETENLEKIIKEKIIPYENQTWFDQQAGSTIQSLKEKMLFYYTEDPKGSKIEIKNIKLRFYKFLEGCKRTDFYKYANNPTGRTLPDTNNQKENIETFSWSLTGGTFINHFKKIAYISPVDFDYNTNEITIFENKYKNLGYEIKT